MSVKIGSKLAVKCPAGQVTSRALRASLPTAPSGQDATSTRKTEIGALLFQGLGVIKWTPY